MAKTNQRSQRRPRTSSSSTSTRQGEHLPHENLGRQNESLIDEANRIHSMRGQGLTLPQIADRLCTNLQNVVNRLQLLRLTPEEQQRVHTGKLGMVKALQVIKMREHADMPPNTTPPNKRTNRKHTPMIKEVEALYSCVVKPASMTDEEWALCIIPGVRRVIAFYLDVEFCTFEDMVKAKGQPARGASC
jgi:hypothetical protein